MMRKRMRSFLFLGIGLGLVSVTFLMRDRLWQRSDFLTSEEREWINDYYRGVVVAPDPRWRPDATVQQQQIYAGLTTDFMELVERKLGVRFMRLYAQSWEQVLAADARREIDIHPVLAQSEERSKDWVFTDPYIRIPMIIVMRASLKDKFSPQKMSTMKMGVGSGYGIDAFVEEHCKGYNIVPVESDRFGLIKTAMGEIDLMITDLASASYYIELEGLTNLRLAATMGSLYEFSFASRRDNPLLSSILNKALKEITREERRAIYDRWIVFDVKPFYRNRAFWYSAGLTLLTVVVVLVVIVVWNMTLKVEVEGKTRELKLARDRLEERVEERTEQLAEANRALQRDIEGRAEMARDILDISGGERARIGRELHDSIGQEMVGVTFLSRAVQSDLADERPEEAERVGRIADYVENIITGMKRIVRGLLPVDIMDKGLVVALAQLAREATRMYRVECRFSCDNEEGCRLSDNALATNIYRIAQEAVGNAAKHASASRITIQLTAEQRVNVLSIADDGHGIQQKDGHAGMGMKIMRYRAELARGSLEVHSKPEEGTRIVCRFDPGVHLDSADLV
ncbi:MAG: transporter substrate-binding domain-containing protein [Verrucomicrobia bacterium]|jgi:signal transduction histidine kinase|nr:transporter substrate-binding domain-containing protein [Verrucomicrobiota bacterium]